MIRRSAAAAIAVTALVATVLAAQTTLRIAGAWVREPVPGRSMAAAYAVVENAGSAAVEIVAVSADVAGTVELHEMARSGDMMKMSPLPGITIPAKGKVALEPGGLHLMLLELKKPLKEGDVVALTFTTRSGANVRATAAVKRAEMKP